MRTSTRLLVNSLSVVGALLVAGCATTTWHVVPGTHRAGKIGVSADIPEGWSRLNTDESITLTKDGFLLQYVKVSRLDYGQKYENTELTIESGQTELEASQVIIGSMKADQDLRNLTLLDNRPVTLDGQRAFRLEFTYKNEDDLSVHEIVYVILAPDGYVVALCRAPARHYIESISGDFERVVSSIRLDPPKSPEG